MNFNISAMQNSLVIDISFADSNNKKLTLGFSKVSFL